MTGTLRIAPDFTPTVVMTGGAALASAPTNFSRTVSNDPTITLLVDWTNTTTHIVTSMASPNKTEWRIEPGSPPYVLYCQGPLQTSGGLNPQTPFTWAAKAAGVQAPGASQCAWADRPPRGTEIKPGDKNTLVGFLNGETNLGAGKFMALDVYRDPTQENDLAVTKVVGGVTPPFSGNPAAR